MGRPGKPAGGDDRSTWPPKRDRSAEREPTLPAATATAPGKAAPAADPLMDTTPASGQPARATTTTTTDGTPAAIGRFELHRKLGEGGMGAVYLATDPSLGRRVAIKVLHREGGDADQARRRLVREAQSTAQLSHEHVIVVHEVGTHAGQVYLAMEYVAGTTLKAWQVGKGLRELLAIYLRAGQGLQAAHAAGLVHRDFKSENVLVGDDGRVRVTDFGLVAAVDTEHRDLDVDGSPAAPRRALELGGALTETGAVMGTPRYMAPEQHLGEPVDARADQFAFCVALYEAVYQQAPFAGHTYDVLVAHVLAGEVLAPPPDVTAPPALRGVLERGLRRMRDERHPSMEELLSALREILDGLDPAVIGRRAPRRWPWIAGAIVGVAAAASIAVAVAVTRGGSRSSAGATGAASMRGGEKALTFRGDVELARLSPDGRLLAIEAGGDVVVAPVDGGPSRVVARGRRGTALGNLAWSSDSRRITVLAPEPGLIDVDTGGFTPRPVYVSDVVEDWPRVSAWLLAALAPVDDRPPGAAVAEGAVLDCELPGSPRYIRDVRAVGASVFVTVMYEDRTTALVVTDRSCASPQVRIGRNDAWGYVPLPDGGALALRGNRRQPDVTRHDRRGVARGGPRRLPLGTTDVVGARPDGSLVLMRSTMTWRLFEQAPEQARDLARGSFPATFALAPDGHRFALIEQRDDDESPLYIVELDALDDRTRRVTSHASAVAWSPDGDQLAVMVTQPRQLLVVDPSTGAARDLGVDDLGSAEVTWLDDRRVAYPRPDNRAYRWIDRIDGTRGDLLDDSVGWTFRLQASPADGSLALLWNRSSYGIWLVPPGGEPRRIRDTDTGARHAWSRDGQTLWIADGGQIDRYDPRTDRLTPFRTLELEPTVAISRIFPLAPDRVLVQAENRTTDVVLYTPDPPL